MVAQLLSFLFNSFSFFAIGGLLKKELKWEIPYFYDFLIGFASVNAFFTLFSIVSPINTTILIVYVLLISILIVYHHRWVYLYFKGIYSNATLAITSNPVLSLITFLFVTITFFQSLYSPSLHYDAALYHIPGIKWVEEYPTLYGLANLNIVLGYNFNIFPLYAALSFDILFGQPIYSINLILIAFFSIWLCLKIREALQLNYYFLAITFLLIAYNLIENYWPHVSTTFNDALVYILVVTILLAVLDYETNKDVACSIVILSVYAITVKLSAGPVLLLGAYVVFTKSFWINKKKAIATLLLSSTILIPWLIKNVLITGWLLFPFPYINLFSVDWKVPLNEVVLQKNVIQYYYVPTRLNAGSNWLKIWLLNQSLIDLLTVALALGILLIVLVKLIAKRVSVSQLYIASLVSAASGIVYMFLTSPSLRYCIAFFLTTIVLSINVFKLQGAIGKYGFYLAGVVLMCVFFKDNWFHPWHFAKNIAQRIVVPYPLESIENKKFDYFLIDNKVKCYYPVGSDQCFDHFLPCTSHRLDNLHLRGETIEQGFYKSPVEKLN